MGQMALRCFGRRGWSWKDLAVWGALWILLACCFVRGHNQLSAPNLAPTTMSDRRTFLRQAALAAGSLAAPAIAAAAPAAKARANKLCFFTKHLQGLPFDEIASLGAEMGVDGIEAPIRPGGHVEPGRIEEDLPKLVEALKKQGLELTIMTSGINQVSAEQNTEKVLRTAAALGVKRYRMNYFKYDLTKPIWPQLQELRPKIKDLVQLSKEIGILPMVQNHLLSVSCLAYIVQKNC